MSTNEPIYYEGYVRDKLEKESNQTRIEAERESKERRRDFELNSISDSLKDSKTRDEIQQLKLKEIREKSEKSSRDIEKLMEKDQEKYKIREEEIRKREKALMEERLKEYDDITAKHTSELQVEKLELEKKLNENEGELDETKRKILNERLNEIEKTEAKMDLLKKEQRDREAARFNEVLARRDEGEQEQMKANRDVAKKKEDYDDKKVVLRTEEHGRELAFIGKNIDTLLIMTSQNNTRKLNDGVERLEELNAEAEQSLQQCQNFFNENLNWDANMFRKARKSFDNLSATCRNISKHLISMERKLADMPDDGSRKEKDDKIREIRKIILEVGTCISFFSGCIMAKNMAGNQEKENELSELMTSISHKINDFGHFDNQRDRMEKQLQLAEPKFEQPAKAIENQTD